MRRTGRNEINYFERSYLIYTVYIKHRRPDDRESELGVGPGVFDLMARVVRTGQVSVVLV